MQKLLSGDNDAEVTPVPIPNTEVKLCSADDTWREAARESRSSPELKREVSVEASLLYFYELKNIQKLLHNSRKGCAQNGRTN